MTRMRRTASLLAVLACAGCSATTASTSPPQSPVPATSPQSPVAASAPGTAPPTSPSPSPSAVSFTATCEVGWSSPDVGPTDFTSATAGTYQAAYASGFTAGAIEVTVGNASGGTEILGGFTVQLSLDGTVVDSFSLGDTTFPRTLPLVMTSGQSENFYDDQDNDNLGAVHLSSADFAAQTCRATAWPDSQLLPCSSRHKFLGTGRAV